ncbi:MAG TPA: hypothetical protein VIC58_01535 [Actinomycetota bacterium]
MGSRATLAGALVLAGGVIAGVGSFLPWVEVSTGPFSEQLNGIEGWEGKASLLAGVVMAVAGIRVFLGSYDAAARMRPSAVVGGLVAAGVGIYTAVTSTDQLLDAAGSSLARADVQRALDSGALELELAVGLYLVILGGIQGVLAAIVSVGARDDAGPATPAGLTGWMSTTASSPAGEPGPAGTHDPLPPPPSPEGDGDAAPGAPR